MTNSLSISCSNFVGIIHLSDIHFEKERNYIQQKLEKLYSALKDDFSNCLYLYIVVSGDIANNGKASEYEVALTFFTELSEYLKKRYPSTPLRFVLAPGNHDCNFNLDTQIRINTIKNYNGPQF